MQVKFIELVKKKEMLMSEIYFNEKIDLFNDGRKYLAYIQEMLYDIQKLS